MAVRERIYAAATSSQSHVIVGVVLLSFVIWVTLKGNLGKYLTYLGFGTPALSPQQQQAAQQASGNVIGGASGSGTAGALGSILGGGGSGGGMGSLIPGLPSSSSNPAGGVSPPFYPGN